MLFSISKFFPNTSPSIFFSFSMCSFISASLLYSSLLFLNTFMKYKLENVFNKIFNSYIILLLVFKVVFVFIVYLIKINSE